MNDELPDLATRLAQLREDFDSSFVAAVASSAPSQNQFLAVRESDTLLAIPIASVAGLHRLPPLVPLPSELPGLRGLVGIQRRLVVVYRLATLLGLGTNGSADRWLVLCAREPTIGLSFTDSAGSFAVNADDVYQPDESDRAGADLVSGERATDQPLATQVVRHGEFLRVVDLRRILATIEQRAQATRENAASGYH